jgi:D-alanyl-lipoteichoic acid acyltransferase DltB (MBOAT superfamily)
MFMYNIWIIFSFVALWHEVDLKLIAWAWLIAVFILPENILKKIFVNDYWKERLGYTFRYFTGLGATMNILLMIFCNLVGFSLGLEGIYDFLTRMMQPQGKIY